MKLDLDDANVYEKSLTVEECRAYGTPDSDELMEKIGEWLDEAQGKVFTEQAQKAYLVIEITK